MLSQAAPEKQKEGTERRQDFFAVLFFARFLGTFAPFFRASESPIAIACLRLVTFLPVPVFKVPFFFLCMAFFTLLPAFFEYFAIVFFQAFVEKRMPGIAATGVALVVGIKYQSAAGIRIVSVGSCKQHFISSNA